MMTSLPLTPSGRFAFEHDLDGARNLPPEFARGPNGGCVGAHDRRANGSQRAIHIGVRVRGNHEGTGHDIAALDHDLVSNAGPGRIEIDSVLAAKDSIERYFLIGFVMILNIVIEREDQLLGIVDRLRTNSFELAHHSRGIVVRHHMEGADGNEVAGAQRTAGPSARWLARFFRQWSGA